MATTKFYLDTRSACKGKPAPLKIALTKKGSTALISLGIKLLPSQWDRRAEKITNHPNKLFLNTFIGNRKLEIDKLLLKLSEDGTAARLTATGLKKRILSELSPEKESEVGNLFATRFLKFANSKKESTKGVYMHTYSRMRAYEPDLERLGFDDITPEWLAGFDAFQHKTSPSKNARNIHLRNIRAVFNDAIDDEITAYYPFRRFKIRPVPTAKRSLTVSQLRRLFSYEVDEYAVFHLDMFKLIFYLIGINVIDLFNLTHITNDGRVEYVRSKTSRFYSIKVEPEALEIINKYKGKKFLLKMHDTYNNHHDYGKHLNKALQHIGEVHIGKHGAKTFNPMFPHLTTYWARHSWATIAAELDIPKETIAAALGHGGNTVTDIYIDFDRRKIDEANRRVMDWVLYGKR